MYCLGYGENRLLNQSIESPANTGTPQFWKIFYSCANPITANSDFAPIQASTSPAQRIANKIRLLNTLQDLGVWLLDASLAALYLPGRPKTDPTTLEACLRLAGIITLAASWKPRIPLTLFASERDLRELSESGSRIPACRSPCCRSRTRVLARLSITNRFKRTTAWFVRPRRAPARKICQEILC